MRVLQVGKFFPPARGGIEAHLATLVRRLAPEIDLEVLVFKHWPSVFSRRENWHGVPVLRMGCPFRPFSTPLSAALPFLLARRRYDVIHVHLPNPEAALVCLLPWVRGALVLSWHSDVVRQKRLGGVLRPVMKRLLARAKGLIVSSQGLLESSGILMDFREKCRIIPYGVEEDQFVETDNVRRCKERLRERLGSPLVLFVGRLVYYKGLEHLLAAVSRLEAHLAIIGRGPMEQKLKRFAARHSSQGRIHFLGEVDHDTLVAAYHLCDLFCLPSVERSEAFGIVQLEAMACGKPVVSTRLPTGVPEVNLDGRTGLVVEPGDDHALMQAIQLLLKRSDLRARFGSRARERVKASYAARLMAEKTLDVLIRAARG